MKGSTTGSFECAKSSRLNRSQSSRTRLVGERRVASIDNGGGIVKSRPGTHCAYPLTTTDYRPRTSRFLGSGNNPAISRINQLSGTYVGIFLGSQVRSLKIWNFDFGREKKSVKYSTLVFCVFFFFFIENQ